MAGDVAPPKPGRIAITLGGRRECPTCPGDRVSIVKTKMGRGKYEQVCWCSRCLIGFSREDSLTTPVYVYLPWF